MHAAGADGGLFQGLKMHFLEVQNETCAQILCLLGYIDEGATLFHNMYIF